MQPPWNTHLPGPSPEETRAAPCAPCCWWPAAGLTAARQLRLHPLAPVRSTLRSPPPRRALHPPPRSPPRRHAGAISTETTGTRGAKRLAGAKAQLRRGGARRASDSAPLPSRAPPSKRASIAMIATPIGQSWTAAAPPARAPAAAPTCRELCDEGSQVYGFCARTRL
eukprot:364813-Chlamydomonas_euryale.AAC.3